MSEEQIENLENTVDVTTNDWIQDLLEEVDKEKTEEEEPEILNENTTAVQKPSFKEAIEMIERLECLVLEETPEVLIHLNSVKNALIEKN